MKKNLQKCTHVNNSYYIQKEAEWIRTQSADYFVLKPKMYLQYTVQVKRHITREI